MILSVNNSKSPLEVSTDTMGFPYFRWLSQLQQHPPAHCIWPKKRQISIGTNKAENKMKCFWSWLFAYSIFDDVSWRNGQSQLRNNWMLHVPRAAADGWREPRCWAARVCWLISGAVHISGLAVMCLIHSVGKQAICSFLTAKSLP